MRKEADVGVLCKDCPFPMKHSAPAIFVQGGSDTPFPLGLFGGDNPFPLAEAKDGRGANLSLDQAYSPEDEVQPADRIRSVQIIPPDANTPEGETPIALIVARGQFPSQGWTGEALLERAYVDFPDDGILDFDFVAVKPRGSDRSLTILTAASQIAVTRGLRGVRVHGRRNEMEALLPT